MIKPKISKIAIVVAATLLSINAHAEFDPQGWSPLLVTPDIKPKKVEEIQSTSQQTNTTRTHSTQTTSTSQTSTAQQAAATPQAPIRFTSEAQAREYFLQNINNPNAIAVSLFNNNMTYRDAARITGYSEDQVRAFLRPSNADLAKHVQENLNNPEHVRKVANTYGLNQGDFVAATGYSPQQVSQYFGVKALDRDIKNLIDQNVSNPAQMVRLLDQYKISPEDASRATGISLTEVNQYIAVGRSQNAQASSGNSLTNALNGTAPAGVNPNAGYYTNQAQTVASTGPATAPTDSYVQPNLGRTFSDSLANTPAQQDTTVNFPVGSFNSAVAPFASMNVYTAIVQNTSKGLVGTTSQDVNLRKYIEASANQPHTIRQKVLSNELSLSDISRATGLSNSQLKEFLSLN